MAIITNKPAMTGINFRVFIFVQFSLFDFFPFGNNTKLKRIFESAIPNLKYFKLFS